MSAPSLPTTRVLATKAPRQRPGSVTSRFTTTELLYSRPWLARPQSISLQDQFLIHTRDNLVSGAVGPKDWSTVTAEFNEAFKDDLRKPLAWKTLSKRCGIARKIFLSENEDYERVLSYPVPDLDIDAEGEHDEDMDVEMMVEEDSEELHEEAVDPAITAQPTLGTHPPVQLEVADVSPHSTALFTKGSTHLTPGFYDPTSISGSSITPLTRAKFHLRHRTTAPVSFHFLDSSEANLVQNDPQYVDMNALIANSPYYARNVHKVPNLTIVDVPNQFSAQTINVFIQLIAPVRATRLPEHYIWKAKKPIVGAYDRFGAIRVEKIVWSVDDLLELLFFAQILEVFWIVDMVIDRLKFLFIEQKRYEAVSMAIAESGSGRGSGASHLPTIATHLTRLTAEDFGESIIRHLAEISMDMPTLRFVVDLLSGLGGKVDAKWMGRASNQVKHIITYATGEYLVNSIRDEYCRRYHHHSFGPEACYTSHATHPPAKIINALYATLTPQELMDLSEGFVLKSGSSSISKNDTRQANKQKEDNSSLEILQAEKMILEMESRIDKSKEALRWAQEASEREKHTAIGEARKAALDMYSPSQL